MADIALQVVVSPFLGVLFDNLNSLIQNEIGILWRVDKEMKKLSSTLSTIRDVLEDAEEKQLTDRAIVNWLRKIKDAYYDADDILDEWATEAKELQLRIAHKQVCDYLLSCFHYEHMKFCRKVAQRIDGLTKRFEEIAAERSNYHSRGGVVERKSDFYKSRETSSIVTEPQVFGRGEETDHIVRLLLDDVNSQENISVYPILGIGGLGKTTVAQLVYNEERVEKHFDVRIWVCVLEEFDIKRLTRAVIISISGDVCDHEDLDPLQRRLQEKLDGKRFLLVLDDVWNEDQEEWNRFKYSLRCGAKGSSIVVTTRLNTVASITGTFQPYCLNFLSEDDCWSLFKQRAFGMGNRETPSLVKIGKEITKKCGGVPLAAKALGGLMRFKREESEWTFVRDSGIWDLPQCNENTILPALRLSYSHLPTYMRYCFAFCSVFPKDCRMGKKEIIHLWMANGLIQSKEKMEMEDIGNEIFDALLWRSFFQNAEKDEDGGILSCTMHDLVHELACSITMNECSTVEVGRSEHIPSCTRHLSLSFDLNEPLANVGFINQSSAFLRTIIFINHSGFKKDVHIDFSTLTSLRAMDLKFAKITTLPVSIGNLKRLRYLNLSWTDISSLPESICELINLQSLKLVRCISLRSLPKYMKNMSSLRHLDIRECDKLNQMPIGIGSLTCLQTLSIFIVDPNNGCHIKELQALKHLRGELKIKGLQHVRSSIESKESSLIRRENLRSLSLAWSDSHSQEENDTDVIEGLQPHSNIKRLFIEGYQGVTFPRWLDVPSLPNLVKISLSKCKRCEHIPPLSRSPLLKSLVLRSMESLKRMDSGAWGMVNAFTSLEELELDDMPELEDWFSLNDHVGNRMLLPCLKKLTLNNCPKLTRLPLSSSLEYLYVGNCSEIVLRTVANLARLSSLTIFNFSELISFPEQMLPNLTALRSLRIWSCEKLMILPDELTSLSSLTSFYVSGCRELKCLPVVGRNSLTELSIKDCSSLTTLLEGLRYQGALQDLVFYGCPKLDISKVEFNHLIALRSLTVSDFPHLRILPEGIQHASVLQHLEILRCPSLTSIPDWISSLSKLCSMKISSCKSLTILPDGLQQLNSLQTLTIRNCHPDLHRRCEEWREDWSHIPNFKFSGW
ncbi:Disease resistance protein rga2 [Thalictrum thalictroides]|uniref:Disease resistance protein rga2 n=1 Tax=Thalictrum thalictroides TaxID=46969 RepID=A0A7J6WSW9_THATH|nr:Disease resistance protein rga2 [Thalictrum thalictroides]